MATFQLFFQSGRAKDLSATLTKGRILGTFQKAGHWGALSGRVLSLLEIFQMLSNLLFTQMNLDTNQTSYDNTVKHVPCRTAEVCLMRTCPTRTDLLYLLQEFNSFLPVVVNLYAVFPRVSQNTASSFAQRT